MLASAEFRIRKARTGLILDQPFFGVLALRLRLVEDPKAPTMWTDGDNLGFSPTFVGKLSDDELKGVVCHEVLHCVLSHHVRRGSRTPKRWNVAADYVVNEVVQKDTPYKLPAGVLINPAYKGVSAEWIYERLPPERGGGKSQSGQDQDSDPGGCGEVRDVPAGEAGPGKGKQGNGAAPSAADKSASEAAWKVATAQAANQAKQAGKLPGSLSRLVGEIISPKLPWRDLLRRFVDQSRKSSYSWAPPNRRHVWRGLYLPSVSSNDLLPVAVGIDTSGSISPDQLREFAGELSAILGECRAPATVIYCDAKIHNVQRFEPDDLPLKLEAKGGGGTDFRPVFGWLDESGETFSCLIFFTDLEGTFPKEPPAVPVLWVHSGGGLAENVPFGDVVELD